MGGVVGYEAVSGVFYADNERSYVINVISEINDYVRNKNIMIKRAGGERTINSGRFVKFPDVLLFSDTSQSLILQGWEAKCPDVPIDDPAFVEDARTKARLLKCNSCILWNFQFAQLHVCNDAGEFEIAERWVIDSRIVDRNAISVYEKEWKSFLHLLIDKVNEYVVTGSIRHRSLGDALTDSVMPTIINQNKEILATTLKTEAAKDVRIAVDIESWWATVKNEYSHDENDPFLAYSKNILVNWLSKFMFANIIQTQYDAARTVADITEGCSIQQALDDFDYITENCDYFNVFAKPHHSEILPDETWNDLVSFNSLLQECDLFHLEPKYSHRILEDSISVTKRQIAGQYPTPEPLAQLMSEIAIRSAYENTWDCCCGTGTIGCSAWKRKVQMFSGVESNAEKIAYQTTWMSDIHDFPLQVATQSFSALSLSNSPLLIFRRNVFDMEPGVELNVVNPETGNREEVSLPLFGSIISNLPFVDFNTTDISWYNSVKERTKQELFQSHGITFSDRNDLYCYIALHLKKFLKDDGVICILTSNSWLCTESGDGFMSALKATFNIDGLYVNGKYRWFKNADVMNVLLVLTKQTESDNAFVNLGVINASIDDLANEEIRGAISRSVISHSKQASKYLHEEHISWEDVRNLKSQGLSYYAICQGASFMLDISEKFVKAEKLFDIARGTKSGQDSFFYSDDPDFVDSEFRMELLKNLRNVNTFLLEPSGYAFVCDKSEEYLQENGYAKTLAHIEKVSDVNDSCKSHSPYWYTLPESAPLSFATSMNTGGRLFFAGAPKRSRFIANQRVLCFKSKDRFLDEDLCLALLNSTLGMFLIEASAAPMALGALDTRAATFREMYVLNPSLVDKKSRELILKAFEPLKSRSINDALVELTLQDRKEFDDAVLAVYGLAGYSETIRNTLKRMLETRLYRS